MAFPLDEHRKLFVEAAKGVKLGGPAFANPDAIGTVQFSPLFFIQNSIQRLLKPGVTALRLEMAQAHFKIGDAPGRLPKKIARKYMGWTLHALVRALTELRNENKALFFDPDILLHQSDEQRARLKTDVLRAAKHVGSKSIKAPNGCWLVVPL
ncbi:MAG: hypothetical protein Q8P02_03925 [Candidatus Micrarchaeota archaeon]|nr:hypothetical protein [Candidatus Micrarchaeota archaeon]